MSPIGDRLPAATYGFIGIGNMGCPMAWNLRKKIPQESKLIICDIVAENVQRCLAKCEGLGPVEVAANPKEITESCDIVISSLPPKQPIEIVFRHPETGILAAKPGAVPKLFIETSSIDVPSQLSFAKAIEKAKLGELVDCPVSGGIFGAEDATLSSVMGGSEENFRRVKPIMSTMANPEHLFHAGAVGSGLACKIINNYVATVSYVALCEGMNAGVRYGLDPKVLGDLINASSGMSWNSKYMNPVKGVCPGSSAEKDFEGGASFTLAAESTEMAANLMNIVGARSLCTPMLRDIWRRAVTNSHTKGREYRSIYWLFSKDDGEGLGNVFVE
ncbi:uncharacterized protein A1O9_06521 [Exophiala aquamarina CBS 119918]|uniref:3-hydroxyisobutyrate dehydrogenase n=1 Tax=Exophiala aquamarina CBS 119918 TaxID=1182545 RepID=A0A072PSU5_9EURO|nr:uncharacterized protein A1O9_06521 [Exophiala aquamarina CBS 119918]KEF58595.1 hypothetical protein A1O9_06521 [Exophiala aquamarina CBS 119918]